MYLPLFLSLSLVCPCPYTEYHIHMYMYLCVCVLYLQYHGYWNRNSAHKSERERETEGERGERKRGKWTCICSMLSDLQIHLLLPCLFIFIIIPLSLCSLDDVFHNNLESALRFSNPLLVHVSLWFMWLSCDHHIRTLRATTQYSTQYSTVRSRRPVGISW